MKRLFILIILGLILANIPCFASSKYYLNVYHELDNKVKVDQALVSNVGFKLLNANKIDKRMAFVYSRKSTVNAFSNSLDRRIIICKGIVDYMDSEDELAGIMAHEISHSIDSYNGILRGSLNFIPQAFVPRKYERKADLRAVDFMVNAGYNPLALIIIMNKVSGQYRYEVLSTHPLTSRRLAYIYEYIYRKYPAFLANNAYIDNIYYQNFLLNSEHNRKKLEQAVNSGSKKRIRYDY
ncbi:M48 family metallopeptidase [bacterium]|nr:M48 family metallopeptidase [bacterium]